MNIFENNNIIYLYRKKMKFNLGPLKNKKNLLTGLTVVAPILGGGLL